MHNQVAYNMEDRIERIDSTTSMSTMNLMLQQQLSGITILPTSLTLILR